MRSAGAGGTRALVVGVLVVFGAALALRASHLTALQASWEGTHLFFLARGDAAHHWREALDILDRDAWLRDRVFWKGPGYSYFLAALMQVFGRSPGALRWPLAILGAVNCAGLVLLARRALSPRWSMLAGLLAAVNGVLILFDGELLFPTLLVSLNLAALWLLTRHRAGRPAHVAAGCLLGLAALVHPVYLAPAAALALWAARRSRGNALAFALAVAVLIAPVTVSNVFVRGQPVVISWNGGINLYAGNHPCFDQYSGNRTNAWARILQTPIDAGVEREYERDRLYYALAFRQALRAPLRTVSILLQKAVVLFSPVEYASNIRLYELREYSPVLAGTLGRWGPLWLPFGLWGPLAIIGLTLMLRGRSPLAGALGMWSLGLAVAIVLSFNTARYRAVLVFLGSIWVAHALAVAWHCWSEGRRRQLAAAVGMGLALVAVLAATAVPQRGFPLPLEWDESVALVSEGALDEAEPWVVRALERAPNDAPLKLAAAAFFHRRGQLDRERHLLQQVLETPDPEPDLISVSHHRRAESFAAEGRIDEARREVVAALAVDVDATDWRGQPYYRLGLGPVTACWLRLEAAGIELDAGNPARAVALMEQVRAECPLAGRLASRMTELEVRAVLAAPRLAPTD
jgi:hypothetical protein